MKTAIYAIATVGEYTVVIRPDTEPYDPRKFYDTLGTCAFFHRRYNLGDDCGFKTPSELKKWLNANKDSVEYYPVYLFDHSGLRMSISDFNDPWDSGQLGVIYVTHDRIRKEYGEVTPETIETAKSVLRGEIETYDNYLSGDVYAAQVFDFNDCIGFTSDIYPSENDEKTLLTCIEAAIYELPEAVQDEMKTALMNHGLKYKELDLEDYFENTFDKVVTWAVKGEEI